jgi:ankyrin repeat protein
MKLETRALLARHIHAPVFDFCVTRYLWDIDSDFQVAAENGRLDTVKYLSSIGADVHADDDYAIRWAVGNGYLDTVKYLVSIGADAKACRRHCAIKWATEYRHFNTLDYLVSIGATTNLSKCFMVMNKQSTEINE